MAKKEYVRRDIATNRKARHEYFIEDTFEAGLVLVGSEIKSLRLGEANINDAFCEERNGEIYLINSHIQPFDKAKYYNHEARRPRKLLLHRNQIRKMIGALKVKGKTIVPLALYFSKKNIAKIEIAIVSGKKEYDKREAIKQADWKREKAQLMKNKMRDF